MATTTVDGTSVVFSNSTAAANLTRTVNEEGVTVSTSSGVTQDNPFVFTFDVLTASGGGTKTTLYSIDNGTIGDNNPLVAISSAFAGYDTDLLYKDSSSKDWKTGGEKSLQGAKIWIGTDNKIHYDLSALASTFQKLGEGQTFTDTLKYTIQMSNGTLSVGTLTVVIKGVNDLPTITGVFTGSVTEDGATQTVQGSVTVSDIDDNQNTFTIGSATNTYGTFTISETGWTYVLNNGAANVQALAAGQTVYDTLTIKTADGTTKDIKVAVQGTNDAPVAQVAIGGGDEGSMISGNVTATDVDSTSLTYAVSGASPAGFTLNTNGSWSLDAANTAYDYLVAGQTKDIVVNFTASDGALTSTPKTLTITITGTNDVPTVSGTFVGSVTEDGTLNASGGISVVDADTGQSSFTVESATSAYGSFSTTGSGWSYALNNGAANVQALSATETVTETLTIKSADGTKTQDIVVTIHGANDAPVTQSATGTVTEDASTSGTLSASDVDHGDTWTFETVGATPTGFSLAADGNWSFDAGNGAYDYLADGVKATLVVTFVARDSNGLASTSQTLTLTVTGTNDVPTVTGTFTGSVAEDGALSASGGITVADPDAGQSSFTVESATSVYGSFSTTGSGWSYALNNGAANVQALSATETVTETLTIKSADGTKTQDIVVTVHGANDAPVAQSATGAVAEDASTSGTLSASDVDHGDTWTFETVGATPTGFSLASDGNWSFDAGNGAYDYLADGVKETLVVTFVARDNNGLASTPQTLTLTVTGANDVPTVTGTFTGSVTEDGTQSASGGVTVADPDAGQSSFAQVSASSVYGTFTVTGSGWSYALNNGATNVQALSSTASVTDTLTIKSADGTKTQDIVVTIHGTNDAPVAQAATASATEGSTAGGAVTATDVDSTGLTYGVVASVAGFSMNANGGWTFDANNGGYNHLAAGVQETVTVNFRAYDGIDYSTPQTLTITVTGANDAATIAGAFTGSVTEDGTLTASGAVTVSDPDDNQSTFSAATSLTGAYGVFSLSASGWSYLLNNSAANVQALSATDTVTDTLTIKSADGGTTQLITVTIHGANDADTITTYDYDTKDVNGNALVQSASTGNGHQFNGSNQGETIVASNDPLNGDGVNAQGGGDIVYARGGDDSIQGQNGDDTIYGGSGNDTINGGGGADSLWGGSGNDTFVFGSGDSTTSATDTINDFHHGFDKIDLSAVYGGTLAWGGTTATANGVWFTESGGFTFVHVDTNGSTGSDEALIRLAGTGLGLTAGDFIL